MTIICASLYSNSKSILAYYIMSIQLTYLNARVVAIRGNSVPAKKVKKSETPLLANLVKAMNWVHHSMQAEVVADDVGPYNISQAIVMCNIILGITRPSEIAREMGLSRQAVSQIINQLEGNGVLESIPDPDHRLAKIVGIKSTSGQKGARAVTQRAIKTVDEKLADRIGKRKLMQLKSALGADWGPVERE